MKNQPTAQLFVIPKPYILSQQERKILKSQKAIFFSFLKLQYYLHDFLKFGLIVQKDIDLVFTQIHHLYLQNLLESILTI